MFPGVEETAEGWGEGAESIDRKVAQTERKVEGNPHLVLLCFSAAPRRTTSCERYPLATLAAAAATLDPSIAATAC